MPKKVVVIFGSPSKNSNTHMLVREAQKGLKEAGAESEVFFLNDMRIKGCQSCLSCKANDTTKCAVKDEMQKIYQAMESSDGILVATPIYFGYVTAQTKIWSDRLFPYLGTRGDSKDGAHGALTGRMPGHKIARFIFTQNQPDRSMFAGQIRQFMNVISLIGFDVKGYMLASDLYRGVKPMVTENKDYMTDAYELGKNFFADRPEHKTTGL